MFSIYLEKKQKKQLWGSPLVDWEASSVYMDVVSGPSYWNLPTIYEPVKLSMKFCSKSANCSEQ